MAEQLALLMVELWVAKRVGLLADLLEDYLAVTLVEHLAELMA